MLLMLLMLMLLMIPLWERALPAKLLISSASRAEPAPTGNGGVSV